MSRVWHSLPSVWDPGFTLGVGVVDPVHSHYPRCGIRGSDLDETLRILPYWPRERYLELAPKHWSATRARLRPEELAVPLSAFEVPLAEPAPVPNASATK